MAMTREETMEAFRQIAEHCKAKGWHHRLKALREHWARAKNGEALGEFAQQLMETMQLPPHAQTLPMRERGSRCPTCGPIPQHEGGGVWILMIIEDRARHHCTRCGFNWLEPA